MGLAVAMLIILIVPFVVGAIVVIFGVIISLLGCILKNKALIFSGLAISVVGVGEIIALIFFHGSISLENKLERAEDFRNLPNKVYLESRNADSFELDGNTYVFVDFINGYEFNRLDDTEYNAVVDESDHSKMKCVHHDYCEVYYVYNRYYCKKDEKDYLWDSRKGWFTVTVDRIMPYEKWDRIIEIEDMDQYLEIWRYANGLKYKDGLEDEGKTLEYRSVEAVSIDQLSGLEIKIAIDENGTRYLSDGQHIYEIKPEHEDFIYHLDIE